MSEHRSVVPDDEGASTIGWLVGFIVIAVILVIGAGLWFTFHP